MTRVVVMDRDMCEPLTVIDVPREFMRDIETRKRSFLRFAVTRAAAMPRNSNWFDFEIPIITMKFEPIVRDGRVLYWVAIPDDEILSTKLRAAFLPGQLNELEWQGVTLRAVG